MDRCGRTLLAMLVVLTGGCSTTPDAPGTPGGLENQAAGPAAMNTVTSRSRVGRSIEGRPIDVHVLGDGPECVLIMASIHGNESAGTPLIHRLGDRLETEPGLLEGKTVVLVPVANPDGVADDRRTNARGIDLNRDFPATNRRTRAGDGHRLQPETRAIIEVVTRYRPSRIISIHQPIGCVDYDGPARPLAQAMSGASGLRLRKLGARPGSLGAWAGVDLGIAVVTIELPGGANRFDGDTLWERYGTMLMTAVRGAEATLSTDDPRPSEAHPPSDDRAASRRTTNAMAPVASRRGPVGHSRRNAR